MEQRKQAILRAVVNEFTTSAVPVGSQSLQSRYFLNLSSATIRTELAELADLGYLSQPHTSAGRIPTDSGYRYFVDFLMDLEEVPERVRGFINDELGHTTADIQGLVERVAMTTAAVTQNASVASAPQGSQGRIKHVDLVSLEPKDVLLILLLEGHLQGCAVALTTYGPSNHLKGVLGVIGPTRMAYSQTVARLRAVARSASERMAELGV